MYLIIYLLYFKKNFHLTSHYDCFPSDWEVLERFLLILRCAPISHKQQPLTQFDNRRWEEW